MTDDRGKRTPGMPSRLSIVVGMAATGSALLSTVYIGWGLWSMREVAGLVLGVGLTLLLFAETLNRVIDREQLLRAQRRAQRADQRFERFRSAETAVLYVDPLGGYADPWADQTRAFRRTD